MEQRAPELQVVKKVAERYLDDVLTVERVTKGASTYVYRVTLRAGIYYLRFLPEDTSFAAEVLAHRLLLAAGVRVPCVIDFEHRERETGFSVMVTQEIPGVSLEDHCPPDAVQDILREAGRQLALIHSITVNGFGWINRSSHAKLCGEKDSFDAYFCEYLDQDLEALHQFPFTNEQRSRIVQLMATAKEMLHTPKAVLVHGDFDVSHIFHAAGRYTGIIDFGEIRGNNRLYDLATFIGFYQEKALYSHLIKGYCDISPLTEEDLYAVELMALFILLRFLGKKAHTPSWDHWCRRTKIQLDYLNIAAYQPAAQKG